MRLWAQPDLHFSELFQSLLGLGWKVRLLTHRNGRSSTWLRALVDSGTDVLMILGESESRPTRFDSVRFGSVRFGSVRFGSVRFGSVPDCDAGTVSTINDSHTWMTRTKLAALRLKR
jgi:hypothetical protein